MIHIKHILHVIVAYLQHFCLHILDNYVNTNGFEYLVVEGFVCTLYLKVLLLNCIVEGCVVDGFVKFCYLRLCC